MRGLKRPPLGGDSTGGTQTAGLNWDVPLVVRLFINGLFVNGLFVNGLFVPKLGKTRKTNFLGMSVKKNNFFVTGN